MEERVGCGEGTVEVSSCGRGACGGRFALILPAVAYALFLALNSFSLWGFSSVPTAVLGEQSSLWSSCYLLSNIASFFAAALVGCAPGANGSFRRVRRVAFLLATVLLCLGLILLTGQLLGVSAWFTVPSGVCMGTATTCLFICWEFVLCDMGQKRRRRVLVAGSLLSVVPFAAYLLVQPVGYLFLLLLFAFLAAGSLWLVLRLPLGASAAELEATGPLPFRGLLALIPSLLCVFVVGVVAVAESGEGLPFVSQGLIVYGESLLGALVLAAVWLWLARDVAITAAYLVAFPILATLLFVPLVIPGLVPVAYLAAGSVFVVFSMLVADASVISAQRHGLPLLAVYGLTAGCLYLSQPVGSWLNVLVTGAGLSQESAMLVSVLLMLYGCSLVLFFVARSRNRSGETVEEAPVAQVVEVAIDPLAHGAQVLAARAGLSERQAQVLDLLAHSYDVPAIARSMCLSENTVRTHIKRIYVLLDVHSRGELATLVNEAARS